MVTKLIKFSASWCGPCRQLAKELSDFDSVPITAIDVDENEELATQYNIRSIPALIYLNDTDEELYRSIGFISKSEIIDKINELNNAV